MLLRYLLLPILFAGTMHARAQVKGSFGIGKDSLLKTGQRTLSNELHGLETVSLAPLQQLKAKLPLFNKGPFVTGNKLDTRIAYTYLDTAGNGMGLYAGRNQVMSYTLTYSASFGHLPFNIIFRGTNNSYVVNHNSLNDLYKLGFDQKKYLEDLQNAVARKVSPEVLMTSAQSRINNIKAEYEGKLQSEVSGIQKQYAGAYATELRLPAGITDLSVSDLSSLGNRLLTDTTLSRYKQSTEQLQELLKTKDAASLKNDTNYRKLSGEAGRYEALQEVYGKIIASKQNFERNKVVTELRNNLSFPQGGYQDFLRHPGNLEKVIDEKLSLSALQRLFVNITHLDIGQSGIQSGDFSLQNVMNNGINTGFKNNKASIGFVYGKNNTPNYWLQSGLSSAITNEYSSVTGFSIGNGSGSPMQQTLSLNFFDLRNPSAIDPGAPMQSSYLPMPQHKDAAISYHSAFSVSGKHSISVDISKSFGSFTNNLNADSVSYKSNAHGDLFKNAGLSNFAGAVDYTGEILKSDVRIFVKKTGLGYNNPGNAYLRRGETQVGFAFARKFYGQRLSVRYNTDYRSQQFDPAQHYTYTAFNNKMQLGLRLGHDSRVAVSYQSIANTTRFSGQAAAQGHNNRLQGDGAYRVRLLHKKILNNVSLSWQHTDIPVLGSGNYKSNTLMFMHTSSVVLNKNLLSLSVISNRSDNTSYYFNTSQFTMETNYSYALINMVRLASAAGYYANTGWNKQLGVKQQVSATFFDRMNVDVELGYKKAVQVIRTDLANQFYVMSTIHYTF